MKTTPSVILSRSPPPIARPDLSAQTFETLPSGPSGRFNILQTGLHITLITLESLFPEISLRCEIQPITQRLPDKRRNHSQGGNK